MTRIRYFKEGNSVLYSKPMLAGNKHVTVHLFLDKNMYNIVSVDNPNDIISGTAVSTLLLKKAAKESLKQLGANFEDEIRTKHQLENLT